MCGIAGTLISPGRTAEQLARISSLFTANLVANEERGREAAGLVLLDRDGNWQLDKAPITASKYVHTDGYLNTLATLSPKTTLMLGHTREPTKGTVNDNANNHPIVRGRIIGVHNGTIKNDDAIFSSQATSGKRIGSVDSEAVFALLDSIAGQMDQPSYGQNLLELSKLLVGSYTILYLNPALPYQVFLLKYKNPMSVHWDAALGALFFSSRYLFLRKAFGRAVITEALPGRTGFMFDARQIAERGKKPLCTYPLADRDVDPVL